MNSILGWLGQNTLTVALLVPLVLLACRIYRTRPAVQHLLWLVLLLKFVTPPILTWPWSLQEMGESARNAAPAWLTGLGWPARGSLSDASALLAGDSAFAASAENRVAEDVARDSALVGDSGAPSFGSSWLAWTLRLGGGAWIVGVVVGAWLQVRRMLLHARLIRQGSSPPPALVAGVLAVSRDLGVRPPRLLVSRGIASPFLWCLGFVRLVWPAILLGDADLARSRGVIAHELAHLRRGDHWVAWVEMFAGVIWFWNPRYWFVRRRMREAAEMACDALAIGTRPKQRAEYAEMLLELSAGCKTGMPAPVLAVSAGTPDSFERRLSMILCERVSGKLSLWGVAAACGLALLILPGWSLAQQAAPDVQVELVADDAAGGTEGAKAAARRKSARSTAADPKVLELIEQGKFDEAKARLEALRAKRSADQPVQEGVFPSKWKESLLKELPAACFKGLPPDAALSWKACMSCHVQPNKSAPRVESLKVKPGPSDRKLGLELKSDPEDGSSARRRTNSLKIPVEGPVAYVGIGKDREYIVTLEGETGVLHAWDVKSGKQLWRSVFEAPRDAQSKDDQWTIEESKDGKLTILVWDQKRDRRHYMIDVATGKVVQSTLTGKKDAARRVPVRSLTANKQYYELESQKSSLELERAKADLTAANLEQAKKLRADSMRRTEALPERQKRQDVGPLKVRSLEAIVEHAYRRKELAAEEKSERAAKSDLAEIAAKLTAAGKSDAELVVALYQAALSRDPSAAERDFCVKYLGSMAKDRQTAIGNIVFQLQFAKETKRPPGEEKK